MTAIPLKILSEVIQRAIKEDRVADLLAALLGAGAELEPEPKPDALTPPGRCQCETFHWDVWDWEYWYNDCWTPRPPECDVAS